MQTWPAHCETQQQDHYTAGQRTRPAGLTVRASPKQPKNRSKVLSKIL